MSGIKELLVKWLVDSSNHQYLSDISSSNSPSQSEIGNDNIENEPPKQTNNQTPHILSTKKKPNPSYSQIKPFYQVKRTKKSIEKEIKKITKQFKNILLQNNNNNNNGLNEEEFEMVTTNICNLTKYCNQLLFNKVLLHHNNNKNNNNNNINPVRITLKMFLNFFINFFSENKCIAFRYIQLLKPSKSLRNYLIKSDFNPLLNCILHQHPGLKFLSSSTEFHSYYISTVICRIFYHLDTNCNNRINCTELRRSNFLDILSILDIENDINEIFDYFSYEHFYVIYIKFWELDQDNDKLLTADDLVKYNDYALIPRVIDRIIGGFQNKLQPNNYTKKQKQKQKNINYITFEDFVIFMLSEEDKTSRISCEYWFRILDIDGDGILSPYEIKYFYEQQSAKIYEICGETMEFSNILTQLNDMIKPEKDYQFTMRDIRKSKMARFFYNTLINLNKFAADQQKDPELMNEIRNSPHMSDWDRFASQEYFILSQTNNNNSYN